MQNSMQKSTFSGTGTVLSYAMLVGCAVLSAFSYHIFVLNNAFAPSGLNGLATMIQYRLPQSAGEYTAGGGGLVCP